MRLALEKASDSLFNLLCKRRDNDQLLGLHGFLKDQISV